MVTNIDLTSPEVIEKKSISGKSALIFSFVLVVVALGLYFSLALIKSRYNVQAQEVSSQINQEKQKFSGSDFSDVFDFQNRLNLLDKVIDDHVYWDSMLKNISSYVVPEVKFNKLSGKNDANGGGLIDVSGTAASLDAVSRQLVLIKTFPDLDSVEFKYAEEKLSQTDQQSEISFQAILKIKKKAFQK
jgi:Tfp pilus assembly protein PilN